MLLLVTCFVTLQTANGYQYFQGKIPNGEMVPHPCKANALWQGVGHRNLWGQGALNPFGQDFKNNGFNWQTVCSMDSDGDGLTNGQELGDPGCTWTEGQIPGVTVGLSHPGICDPMSDRNKCGLQPEWVSCEKKDFVCDVLNEPETFNYTVRLPELPVPARETTYTCLFFEFPTDQEYHLVANTPHIENEAALHHMVVFGCRGDISKEEPLNTAQECGMASGNPKCLEIISMWSVGAAGTCEHPHSGFLIGGLEGYRYGAIQLHWNNPELRSGTTDSSGVNLFLTPKLRRYNAGVFMVGQNYLEIPPQQLSITAKGGCSSRCTEKYMRGDINITAVFNHMHYLGRSQLTEIRRYGERLELANDETYSYDSPVIRKYDRPIVAHPGDEIMTTCVFKSTTKSGTTYFGRQTADEMCVSFLTYYPKEKILNNFCENWRTIDSCEFGALGGQGGGVVQGCNFTKLGDLRDSETNAIYRNIGEKCGLTHCRKECKEYIKALKSTDPCYKGDVYQLRKFGYDNNGNHLSLQELQFYTRVDSCDERIGIENYIEALSGEKDAASGSRASMLACFVGLVMSFVL